MPPVTFSSQVFVVEVVVLMGFRHNPPHGLSTGIHYDRIFLRGSPSPFLTAWVPIGDVSPRGGGLMYLSSSTSLGKRMEAEFMRAAEGMSDAERVSGFNRNMARDGQLGHDAAGMLCELNGHRQGEGRAGEKEAGVGKGKGEKGKEMKWVVGDFKAGDVVFHNPYLIHGACKNEDENGVIRLSTDLRFYEEGVEVDERWMRVWRPDDGL
jgi:phytanoyl-CoA hydroxylase